MPTLAESTAAFAKLSAEDQNLVTALVGMIGVTRVSVNFTELFTTLIDRKLATPFADAISILVPKSGSVTVTLAVPPQQVVLVTEGRVTFSRDHALSSTLEVDGLQVVTDPDMVMMAYNVPLNFLEEHVFYPARKQVVVTINNSSAVAVYAGVKIFGGRMNDTLWDEVIETYFETILEAIREKVA